MNTTTNPLTPTVLCPSCGKQRAGRHDCDGIELDVSGLNVLANLGDVLLQDGVAKAQGGHLDDARRSILR